MCILPGINQTSCGQAQLHYKLTALHQCVLLCRAVKPQTCWLLAWLCSSCLFVLSWKSQVLSRWFPCATFCSSQSFWHWMCHSFGIQQKQDGSELAATYWIRHTAANMSNVYDCVTHIPAAVFSIINKVYHQSVPRWIFKAIQLFLCVKSRSQVTVANQSMTWRHRTNKSRVTECPREA